MGLVWDGPRVGWGHGEGACPGCGMQEEARPAWMEAVSRAVPQSARPAAWGQGGLGRMEHSPQHSQRRC